MKHLTGSIKLVLFVFVVALVANTFAAGGHDHHGHDDEHRDHEETKGPHGGKLLNDGDIELELAIVEKGIPPEYRAWIKRNGEPVSDASLVVTLTRLNGEKERFDFAKQADFWRSGRVVNEPHSFDVAADLTLDGTLYQWRWESYEGRVEIATDMAEKLGITTATAGPGTIERHLPIYGRLVTPSPQNVQLRARFPGVIKEVRATIGEQVRKGDVLAVVESNESLQSYQVRSPIEGIVIERNANPGETTTDQPLFVVIDNTQLWVEIKLFPKQRAQVAPGQGLLLQSGQGLYASHILHLTPSADESPFVLARALLPNPNGEHAPGDWISGKIVVETRVAPLAVDNRALQSFRDWTVVFVKVGDFYEVRPLELGQSDGRFTEVLKGLSPGDNYVVENSYLIKADVEKSGASHDH